MDENLHQLLTYQPNGEPEKIIATHASDDPYWLTKLASKLQTHPFTPPSACLLIVGLDWHNLPD